MHRQDLRGKFFGILKVLEYDKEKQKWKCLCKCGNIHYVQTGHLNSGETNSCGCERHSFNDKNMIGKRFGRLTVLNYEKSEKQGRLYKCKCDCGNIILVFSKLLNNKHIQSCGCLKKEIISKVRTKNYKNKKVGNLLVIKRSCSKNGSVHWECKCSCGNLVIISSKYLLSSKNASCGCLKRENSRIMLSAIKAKQVGENHPLWKGGITPERILGRNKKEAIDWKKEVFKRDNYICQKCGKKSGLLNCHHIYSFAEHKNLRYIIQNGITLCRKCHHNFHRGEMIYNFEFVDTYNYLNDDRLFYRKLFLENYLKST